MANGQRFSQQLSESMSYSCARGGTMPLVTHHVRTTLWPVHHILFCTLAKNLFLAQWKSSDIFTSCAAMHPSCIQKAAIIVTASCNSRAHSIKMLTTAPSNSQLLLLCNSKRLCKHIIMSFLVVFLFSFTAAHQWCSKLVVRPQSWPLQLANNS